jgi:hypothetical protein
MNKICLLTVACSAQQEVMPRSPGILAMASRHPVPGILVERRGDLT